MRRKNKKTIATLTLGLLFTYIYCEYLIYYIVSLQCSWPNIGSKTEDNVVRAFILADIHMLGPWRGHWLDKWRREWQMHRAFQSIVALHQPEVVFILGDIFDEGEWTNDDQFEEYVTRFHRLFYVPENTQLYIVVGNHDVGFHNKIRRGAVERFIKKLRSPSVQHLVIKGSHFVLLNSMALHGDSCNLCTESRRAIQNISDTLNCYKNKNKCSKEMSRLNYSRPIIMQHFPLYRVSDAVCTDPDAPPLSIRNKKFRLKIDSLSEEATEYLVQKIKPRVVFGGHTHHGCLLQHVDRNENNHFEEFSVPSFSWRNRPNPKYMLVSITPDDYAVTKCGLPLESSIIIIACILVFITLYTTFKMRFYR